MGSSARDMKRDLESTIVSDIQYLKEYSDDIVWGENSYDPMSGTRMKDFLAGKAVDEAVQLSKNVNENATVIKNKMTFILTSINSFVFEQLPDYNRTEIQIRTQTCIDHLNEYLNLPTNQLNGSSVPATPQQPKKNDSSKQTDLRKSVLAPQPSHKIRPWSAEMLPTMRAVLEKV